jgi:hypothetical protein
MKSDLVDIAVQLHHETDKAWLVSDDGVRAHAKWIPKSLAQIEVRGKVVILTLSERLATEKGFA